MSVWRKRLHHFYSSGSLYPKPVPMRSTRLFWLSTTLATGLVLLFCGYFIFYLTQRHVAFLSNAEDLGIMDQVFWSLIHTHSFHQTICNILSDTNCYGSAGINRFAIHFEPILYPLALLYLVVPGPPTLLVMQTIIVALGAYPAFWLARLRLRNDLAGVAIALLYLLYPALQQATVADFHAVTFTAALLLFTLYFMYTRRTVLLFVFAILSMACKEEISLVIAMFGLWSLLFQGRWRSGLLLILLGLGWFFVTVDLIMPAFSPVGQPLLHSRFEGMGKGPVQIATFILLHPAAFLHQYVLSPARLQYLRTLLTPAGFLPLLAPWVLFLALPSLAINLLSSDPQMYSGLYHYNAEIVPVLIFSVIEAIVFLRWLLHYCILWWNRHRSTAVVSTASVSLSKRPLESFERARVLQVLSGGLTTCLLLLVIFTSVRSDYYFHGNLPFSQGFSWPQATAHTALTQKFINMIPDDASVSAQSALAPHISARRSIYLFPYAVPLSYPVYAPAKNMADYVFLDVTGNIYPYTSSADYVRDVKMILLGGQYGIVAAQDGFLLLKHGLAAPGIASDSVVQPTTSADTALAVPNIPRNFCSYIYTSPATIKHPLQATFSGVQGDIKLLGYNLNASNVFSISHDYYVSITTYWQVAQPVTSPLQLLFFLQGKNDQEYYVDDDVPATLWCQTQSWQPGAVVKLTTSVVNLKGLSLPGGNAQLSLALLPLLQSSASDTTIQSLMHLSLLSVHPAHGTDGRKSIPLTTISVKP